MPQKDKKQKKVKTNRTEQLNAIIASLGTALAEYKALVPEKKLETLVKKTARHLVKEIKTAEKKAQKKKVLPKKAARKNK